MGDGKRSSSHAEGHSVSFAGGLKNSFRFANPAGSETAIVQEISRSLTFDPKPESVTTETTASATHLPLPSGVLNEIRREGEFQVAQINLTGIKSSARILCLPGQSPKMQKSYSLPRWCSSGGNHRTFKTLKGALSAWDAATAIMNWVVDNIRYRTLSRL